MSAKTVTRADLVDALCNTSGISRQDCTQVLESVLELLEEEIVKGEKVKLSRFGNFVVREKPQRLGRNPKTGEEVPITARRVVTFRPSHLLRKKVEDGGA